MLAVDPTLAFRDFQRLKLKHGKLLSKFAFNCYLSHYAEAADEDTKGKLEALFTVGRCRLTPG